MTVDVLASDTDDEGSTLLVVSFDAVASDGGTVGLDADGRLVFTPAANANGTASPGCTVTDAELTDSGRRRIGCTRFRGEHAGAEPGRFPCAGIDRIRF